VSLRAAGARASAGANVREEQVFYWPSRSLVGDGGVFDQSFEQQGGAFSAAWGGLLGAGTTVMRYSVAGTRRMLMGEWSNAMRWIPGLGARVKETDTGLAGAFRLPPFWNVYEISWLMRGSQLLDANAGLLLLGWSSTTPDEFPGGGFTRPGFGIRGDAASPSGWSWEVWNNNALVERVNVPVSLVAGPTDVAQYSLEIIAAAPGRQASCTLRVNRQTLVRRDWVAAPALPFPDSGLAAGNVWVPAVRGKQAAGVLNVGPMMVRYSRFGLDGRDYSI
jgi:hypothetical protein